MDMDFAEEIQKLLEKDRQLRVDFSRISAVAQAVTRDNEDNFLPYLWAYASGERDWKEAEKQLF